MREPPNFTCGGDSGEIRAKPKGKELKARAGKPYYHVEFGSEVAGIYDVALGY